MTVTDSDKRVAQRHRVIKSAKIVSLDRSTVSDCTIRNISSTGAQIIVENQALVPREFYFLQPKENTMCQAKVMWRREKLVGVHFTSEMGSPPATMRNLRS